MRGEPLAFLLTWTCYGARLHGDARGSVDARRNRYGQPGAPNSADRRDRMQARMADPPVVLTHAARAVVDRAIRDHCAHRAWWVGAVNVRSNHAHCVVSAPGVEPGEVMRQLKSWGTRRLREAGLADAGRVWTHHGSTRYLFERRAVELAIQYTLEEQSGARFDAWLEARPDG